MNDAELVFQPITATAEQIQILFELLCSRKHAISHDEKTSLKAHTRFVENNPYIAWYIVRLSNKAVGTFYVSAENTIGINLTGYESPELLSRILKYVRENHSPLPGIASVRGSVFSVNVPSSNHVLCDALKETGAKLVQLTFHVDDV